MKHTKLLSLIGQNLQQITDTIFEDASAAGVTCVDLSKNKFSTIPEKLSLIKTVEDLKLSCNQLTSLPNWMGESFARHLRYLDLSKNQLTSMPDSIGLLENLREINISQNRFTIFKYINKIFFALNFFFKQKFINSQFISCVSQQIYTCT